MEKAPVVGPRPSGRFLSRGRLLIGREGFLAVAMETQVLGPVLGQDPAQWCEARRKSRRRKHEARAHPGCYPSTWGTCGARPAAL